MIVCHDDRTAKVWDIEAFQEIQTLNHEEFEVDRSAICGSRIKTICRNSKGYVYRKEKQYELELKFKLEKPYAC